MCIKIVSDLEQKEFDPMLPLESQVCNAKQILVSYDPQDIKIPTFVYQIENMVQNGMELKADIKVDPKNNLDGLRLERRLELLKEQLEINEIIKGISSFHATTDKKLCELSAMCLGKVNE